MNGKIVTIHDVISLNHILLDKGLNYKVHLHDACGRQSLSAKKVERLETEVENNLKEIELKDETEILKSLINTFFNTKNMEVVFTGQSLEFVIN